MSVPPFEPEIVYLLNRLSSASLLEMERRWLNRRPSDRNWWDRDELGLTRIQAELTRRLLAEDGIRGLA